MKRIFITSLIIILSLVLLATGCGEQAPVVIPSVPEERPSSGGEEPGRTDAAARLSDMTLREKIGQLFIIRPDSLDSSLSPDEVNDSSAEGVKSLSGSMRGALADYPAGGIAIFGKNIESAEQLAALLDELGGASKTPLFIAVDEEGGVVARIANSGCFDVPIYENMGAVGDTGNPSNAREVGLTIGGYLKNLGFNLDFAPDADVNTNPDNPIIGTRAFGSDPELVAEMVASEIGGFHDTGVMCCVKHYPGHGDTSTDTHLGYASTDKTWDELRACELIPFISGIDAGADMVMAAHITAVNVDPDGLPASLSRVLLTDKLRGELGYGGVIITDSLAMGAITEEYSPSEAAVAAIGAGVDILLMPQDYAEAFEGLLAAVQSGELSEARIDESVLRILKLKEKYGLI